MRVSVITVCLNPGASILRTRASLSEQGVDGIQWVVIDGGSSDGTQERLASGERKPDVLVSEPDKGISDAFNKGLRHATGDIIGILNADDWYERNAITAATKTFARTGAEVVHGWVRYWDGNIPVRVAAGSHHALRRSGSVNHPSVFVRREIYQHLGTFDTSYRYAMDYELMLRWLVRGVRFRQLPRVLANMSLGGVSDRRRLAALHEVRTAQRRHLDPFRADLQHLLLGSRFRIRRLCETLGLDHLVAWQRRRNRGMRSLGEVLPP